MHNLHSYHTIMVSGNNNMDANIVSASVTTVIVPHHSGISRSHHSEQEKHFGVHTLLFSV